MTEGAWTVAVVRQFWAEGIDWRADAPTAQAIDPHGLDELLARRATLPVRDVFPYPGPEPASLVVPLYARFANRYTLVPWLECLWGGAFQGSDVRSAEDASRFDRLAHWRLNLLIGKQLRATPEQVVKLWADRPSEVQTTPAEQQILRWYTAQEPWLQRWHPFREGTGAMRRAPIWGAVFRAAPEQAAAAAMGDARTAYAGWGVWTAMVVAYAIAQLPQDWAPADAVQAIVAAMTRLYSQSPGVEALNRALRREFPGDSWDAWGRFVAREFAGYPLDHSLPNLLLVVGALHWYAAGGERLMEELDRIGWDSAGNRLVAGALLGRRWAGADTPHALLASVVEATVAAHGHPPNV